MQFQHRDLRALSTKIILFIYLIRQVTGFGFYADNFECGGCRCSPSEFPTHAFCNSTEADSFPSQLPPAIKVLNLDNNLIKRLDGMLSMYSQLEDLSIRNNQVWSLRAMSVFLDFYQEAFIVPLEIYQAMLWLSLVSCIAIFLPNSGKYGCNFFYKEQPTMLKTHIASYLLLQSN